MQYKYAPYRNKSKTQEPRGSFPNNWKSGPEPIMHEMYYAWSKHRAQARYRSEPYELTWADWQVIFANTDDFLNRGRQAECIVLTRRDTDLAWSLDNCELITRYEQLLRDVANKDRRRHSGKTNILHSSVKDGTQS